MVQRRAVFMQWEVERDLGREQPTSRIFGGGAKLLIEQTVGDYFDIPMSDPAPVENPNPIQAAQAFGLGVDVEGYTRDTNYQEAPAGVENTPATVGSRIHLLGGRHSSDRKAGTQVIVPTQVSYQTTRTLPNGEEETITKYKVKSFTFPKPFNVTMIRQALGQMIRKRFPQVIKIAGTTYDFVQFPLEQQRFTPPGMGQATSGAWLVENETAMRTRPSSTQEEYWNQIHTSVANGIPI
ncbi:hypothetical protein BI308_26015 [Roseofilum reptotaenium AO1-A]|uniref:Uncharacterized protein n=1 Tax=Roseofilum reptotaenium AO1-A TaxID=1925591 RepID=A0A1L9QA67_9CYAN|nr:hypothetical protein BI308_26015 [Roseofilum reptotaenium AO1-A]